MDAPGFVSQGKLNQSIKELSPVMQQLQSEYPMLGRFKFHVRGGDGLQNVGGGHSEVYPAWDKLNPSPGVHTIALFDRSIKGQQLKSLLLGETFHVLGAIDPRSNKPIDPQWFKLKQQFLDSLTPEQIEVDLQDYSRLNQRNVTYNSVADYYQINRLDAYFRGYLSPVTDAEAKDWGSAYTPQQKKILEQARAYLKKKEN